MGATRALAGVTMGVVGLWRARQVRSSLQFADSPIPAGWPDPSPKLRVVIPALREQLYIERALRQFMPAVQQAPPGCVTVTVVTTERENHDRIDAEERLEDLAAALQSRTGVEALCSAFLGVLPKEVLTGMHANVPDADVAGWVRAQFQEWPTTSSLVSSLIVELNEELGLEAFFTTELSGTNEQLSEIPNPCAAQMNLGWQHHRNGGDEDSYMVVFDADSVIGDDQMRALAWAIAAEHELPPVVQQHAVYTNHVGAFEDSFRGDVHRAAGVAQTVRSLGVELPQHRASHRKGLRRPYTAVTAHGLAVRGDVFDSHGGFTTTVWGEDLILSFVYHLRNYPIVAVVRLEENEMAHTWRGYWSQTATWFKTASHPVRSAIWARQFTPQASLPLVASVAARRGLSNAAWLLGGPLWSVAVVSGAVGVVRRRPGSALLLAGCVLSVVAPSFVVWRRALPDVSLWQRFRQVLSSMVFFSLFSWVGPAKSVAAQARGAAAGTLEKTER